MTRPAALVDTSLLPSSSLADSHSTAIPAPFYQCSKLLVSQVHNRRRMTPASHAALMPGQLSIRDISPSQNLLHLIMAVQKKPGTDASLTIQRDETNRLIVAHDVYSTRYIERV